MNHIIPFRYAPSDAKRLLGHSGDLIIWYAIGVHLLWAASMLLTDGAVKIPALRGMEWMGHIPLAILCALVSIFAIAACSIPATVSTMLLLAPQQALLMIAAIEAGRSIVDLFFGHAPMSADAILAPQGRNIILAGLHTWAMLRPFMRGFQWTGFR